MQLRCLHPQGGPGRSQQVTSRRARLRVTAEKHCQSQPTNSSCCSTPTGRVSSSDSWAANSTTVVERSNLATLAAAICVCFGCQQNYAAFSKPALLDLPACSNYQQAGTIKYGYSQSFHRKLQTVNSHEMSIRQNTRYIFFIQTGTRLHPQGSAQHILTANAFALASEL